MRAFSSSISPSCRQHHAQGAAVSQRAGCNPHCSSQVVVQLQQQRQRWSLRAVPEDGAPEQAPAAAAASEQQPSAAEQLQQQQQQSSKLTNLANSLGNEKAFVSEEEWRVMDKKVNKYPSQRVFTAIGVGGDGFKASMLKAVEDVVGTVHLECVSERPSSGGKYVSIRVGPVWVESADQVIQVFSNMRKDDRLKWYM